MYFAIYEGKPYAIVGGNFILVRYSRVGIA